MKRQTRSIFNIRGGVGQSICVSCFMAGACLKSAVDVYNTKYPFMNCSFRLASFNVSKLKLPPPSRPVARDFVERIVSQIDDLSPF